MTPQSRRKDPITVRVGQNPYVRATLAVAAALLVRLTFYQWLGTAVPLLTFLAAVVVAARWGGLGGDGQGYQPHCRRWGRCHPHDV